MSSIKFTKQKFIKMEKFKIPVVFIFYNRIDISKKTLKNIFLINPKKIYLISDGPKDNTNMAKINKLRLIVEKEIKKRKIKYIKIYSNKNLGSERNIINGLNKIFKLEKKAIIIEDDCLVDKSFFKFSEKLLSFYQNNKKIWGITAQTFNDGHKKNYYLSKYAHCWGWATWSDRWNVFDYRMKFWSKWIKSKFWSDKNNYIDYFEQIYWKEIYQKLYKKKLYSWNYRWQCFIWKKNGYFIHPNKNMVENIGFNSSSVNTKAESKKTLFRKKLRVNNFTYQKKLVFSKYDDILIFDKIYFSLKNYLSNNFFDLPSVFLKENIYKRITKKITNKFKYD